MSLFKERIAFKPFEYAWCYDAWLLQQQVHWLPEEVPMADDVQDYRKKLTDGERNLLTHIFRLFTQSDVEVSKSYHTIYLSRFKPIEVQMMLMAFQNMETIHAVAYAHLLDTLGLPEVEYSAFMNYQAMKDKWEHLQGFFNPKTDEDLALSMAVFGAFTEGLQLFASFAMLLNFQRFNKMKGMGQIITWSVRDESLHCEAVIRLFRTLLDEKPELNTPQLRARIEEQCRLIVEHEDAFIDLAFEMGPVEGMSAADIKQYIRFIADRRLIQLGYKGIFKVKVNPLGWLDTILNAPELANFFEQRATEYAKASTTGTWEEAYDDEPQAYVHWRVYSKSNCPQCVTAKAMFKRADVAFEEVDLSDNEEMRQQLYASLPGVRSMPIIMRNGEVVAFHNLTSVLASHSSALADK